MKYRYINNPIIICGCPGGGTSYVTKLLRFSGLDAGNDSGSLDDRKFHESLFFKNINKKILVDAKIPKIIWDTADLPKAMSVFGNDKIVQKIVYDNFTSNKELFYSSLIKSYPSLTKNYSVWGWKDPRNSITLPFWLNVFPGAKVLFITKKHNKNAEGISKSGKAFIASEKKLRQFYFMPPYFDKKVDHLTIRFEEVTSEFGKFNELMAWAGLYEVSKSSFEDLLYNTKYEGVIGCTQS